jgi:WD40 repeat protein
MGTPDYIAPEQALDSHTVDIRSDLYSLGCTLYFLLTRQVPFPGGTLGEKLVKHQLKEPQPVEQLRPEVSPAVAAVLRKMMAKRPGDRYQTPAEVARALDPFARSGDDGSSLPAGLPDPGAPTILAATRAVPVVFEHTIDPTAPMALPVSDTSRKPGLVPRIGKWARQRPWLAGAGGSAGLAVLTLGVILLLRSGSHSPPAKPADKGVEKTAKPEPTVILGSEIGRHWAAVRCVAFHPKEPLAASGGADQVIRLWNAETLEEKGVLPGHGAAVTCLAFSPKEQQLISGGDDGTVRLWDLAKRKQIRKFGGNSGAVSAVAFAPDGRLVLASSGGATALLFEVQSGEIRGSLTAGTGQVQAVAFDSSGQYALTAGDDMLIRLWNVEGRKLIRSLKGHTEPVWSVAFSPDGKRVLSGSRDKSIRLWRAATGKQIAVQEGHGAEVRAVAFTHDGRYALSGGLDQTLRLWNGTTLQPRRRWQGHTGAVWTLAFSRDDRRVLSGGDEHLVRLWDVQAGKQRLTPHGHTRAVQNLVFSSDGRLLLSAGDDHTVRLWDLARHKPRFEFQTETDQIPYLAFAPDNSQVIFRQGRATLRVADAADGHPVSTPSLPPNYQPIKQLLVLPRGGQGLCCGNYKSAFLLNLGDGNTWDFDAHMDSAVRSIALSSDGRRGLSGGNDWKIWLFALDRKMPSRPFAGHTDAVVSLAFTPDGKHALSAGADRAVWRWDLEGHGRTRLFEIPAPTSPEGQAIPLNAIAIAPDGRVLATCDNSGRVIVRDVSTGKKLKAWSNSGPVLFVAFSADSRRLAAARANGTIALYPVPAAIAANKSTS